MIFFTPLLLPVLWGRLIAGASTTGVKTLNLSEGTGINTNTLEITRIQESHLVVISQLFEDASVELNVTDGVLQINGNNVFVMVLRDGQYVHPRALFRDHPAEGEGGAAPVTILEDSDSEGSGDEKGGAETEEEGHRKADYDAQLCFRGRHKGTIPFSPESPKDNCRSSGNSSESTDDGSDGLVSTAKGHSATDNGRDAKIKTRVDSLKVDFRAREKDGDSDASSEALTLLTPDPRPFSDDGAVGEDYLNSKEIPTFPKDAKEKPRVCVNEQTSRVGLAIGDGARWREGGDDFFDCGEALFDFADSTVRGESLDRMDRDDMLTRLSPSRSPPTPLLQIAMSGGGDDDKDSGASKDDGNEGGDGQMRHPMLNWPFLNFPPPLVPLSFDRPMNEMERSNVIIPFDNINGQLVRLEENDLILVLMPLLADDTRVRITEMLEQLREVTDEQGLAEALVPYAPDLHALGLFYRGFISVSGSKIDIEAKERIIKDISTPLKFTKRCQLTGEDVLLESGETKLSLKHANDLTLFVSIEISGMESDNVAKITFSGGAVVLVIHDGETQFIDKLPFNLGTSPHHSIEYGECNLEGIKLTRGDVIILLLSQGEKKASVTSQLLNWTGTFMSFDEDEFEDHARMALELYGQGVTVITALIA
jgi:hypothetical protein